MDNPEHWTAEELAEILRVHVVTVRRWIPAGQLGAIRLPGGGYRIPQAEFDRLCAAPSESARRIWARNKALSAPRPKGLDLDLLASTLPDAAARIKEWVLEASEDDMELILEALHIQVSASRGEVQIEGSVPVLIAEGEDLVTIARTSA